jgi:hypothetical protein
MLCATAEGRMLTRRFLTTTALKMSKAHKTHEYVLKRTVNIFELELSS